MPTLCSRPWLCIRSPILCIAIIQLIAYLAVPIVHSGFDAPREGFEETSERIKLVRTGIGSKQQSLTGEPTHLSLGTGLYLIEDRPRGKTREGSCLGRRKWVEKERDIVVQSSHCQGSATEPLGSALDQNGTGELTYRNRDLLVNARSQKMDTLQGTNYPYDGLPQYILSYLASTQQSATGFIRDLDHQTPASDTAEKIICDKMCDYEKYRKKHLVFVNGSNSNLRQRTIVEANDNLGSQEIKDLVLQNKESNFVKELLGMKNLGDFFRFGYNSFYSAIVDAIRSVRAALYRIRILDDMCEPPLFDNLVARKDCQKEAFELLRDFWTKHVFPAISHIKEKERIIEAKPGSLEDLIRLALLNISKRSGQVLSDKTALSWLVFRYWCEKRLSVMSSDLYKRLREYVIKGRGWREDVHPAFKIYFADQAVEEALKARMITSEYQIMSMAQFKLRQEK